MGVHETLSEGGRERSRRDAATTVTRAVIRPRSTLHEAALSSAEEVPGIRATVLVQRTSIGADAGDLDTEIPTAFSMGRIQTTAILVTLTGIGAKTERRRAAVGRAEEVRVRPTVLVIGALRFPLSR